MSVNIKQQVRQFILDNFMMGTGTTSAGAQFSDEASFMDGHIIDSTGFLELIAFIERSFDIRIDDDEMIPENLDSLSNIERFVQQKHQQALTLEQGRERA